MMCHFLTRSAFKTFNGGVMLLVAGKYADAVDSNDMHAVTCACVV